MTVNGESVRVCKEEVMTCLKTERMQRMRKTTKTTTRPIFGLGTCRVKALTVTIASMASLCTDVKLKCHDVMPQGNSTYWYDISLRYHV